MKEFLVNNLGYIVSWTLAATGLFFGYRNYIKSKRKVSFGYYSKTTQLFKKPDLDQLKIEFKGKEISRLSVTKVLFFNSGNYTIKKSDVSLGFPIKVSNVESENNAFSWSVVYVTRESSNIVISEELDKDECVLEFDYLNSGDACIVQVLHEDLREDRQKSPFEISGEIIGLNKMELLDKSDPREKANSGFLWFCSFLFFGLIYVLYVVIISEKPEWNSENIGGVIGLVGFFGWIFMLKYVGTYYGNIFTSDLVKSKLALLERMR